MADINEEVLQNLTLAVATLRSEYDSQVAVMKENSNAFFLIVNAILIYFMQCGFAFVECGAVRSKNATNILIKNLLDSFISAISYWIIGYSIAFGGGNFFLGTKYWAHAGLPEDQLAFWFFQFVFAATASTIVSGAMAERCHFTGYLVYSVVVTGFIYPVVTHWAWSSEGWLSQGLTVTGTNGTDFTVSYNDFAGSGVVHLTGGVAALIGSSILGPRLGRFKPVGDGGTEEIRGHSVPLSALGGFILFFGFFAFNGGSQASISEPGDGAVVAKACINTMVSASFAAFMGLITTRIKGHVSETGGKWSFLATVNSALAGMVAICAGCNAMPTWGAAITGAIAGCAYMFWSWVMVKIKVDDPVDAFAVHAGGGMWGVIAASLFTTEGVFLAFGRESLLGLGWQFVAILAIIGWTAILAVVLFGLLRLFKLLRVDEEIELKGLDIPKHGEPAYPVKSYGHGWLDDYIEQAVLTAARKSIVAFSKGEPRFRLQTPDGHSFSRGDSNGMPRYGESSEVDAINQIRKSHSMTSLASKDSGVNTNNGKSNDALHAPGDVAATRL